MLGLAVSHKPEAGLVWAQNEDSLPKLETVKQRD